MLTRIATRWRMEALLADRDNDAILVMNVPTALASATDAAKAVAAAVRAHRSRIYPPKPVFAVWVGDSGEAAAAVRGCRAFPTTLRNPTPCEASCISCAIGRRSTT